MVRKKDIAQENKDSDWLDKFGQVMGKIVLVLKLGKQAKQLIGGTMEMLGLPSADGD